MNKTKRTWVRVGTLLLVVCMILVNGLTMSAAATAFPWKNPDQAKLLALNCFMKCAFNGTAMYDAYGNPAYSNEHPLLRFDGPIRIYMGGSPDKADIAELDKFIRELAVHCPNMPNVHRVSDKGNSNIEIWYGPLDQLKNHTQHYSEGSWGSCYYNYWDNRINSASVVIANDVNTQKGKNYLLRKELMCVFGLTTNHNDYSDSILYKEWTDAQQLSDLDWLMLNMLYDKEVYPGMNASYCFSVLATKINRY